MTHKNVNTNLATDKDFEIVQTKWKSVGELLKEANRRTSPKPAPKPQPQPPKAEPPTRKATTTDTSKKGGGK